MRIIDLIGHTYGHLEVIASSDKRDKGSPVWVCRCICGVEKELSARRLRSKLNGVKSCGCRWQQSTCNRATWTGYGEIPGRWWSHSCNVSSTDKRRAISKTLTIEQAWDLFLSQDRKCVFTGDILVISSDSTVNTASIDRIDSTLGYDLGNVQWVHKEINMMKRTHTDAHFIELCKKVASYANR